MKRQDIQPRDVEAIPPVLDEGILYISERYRVAMHKCCCGCGEEVVSPLNPAEWSVIRRGRLVSLFPSIGNWNFACKSHYWIKANRIVWSGRLTAQQIQAVQAQDNRAKVEYVAELNRVDDQKFTGPGFWGRLCAWIAGWMKRIR
jgi:hypothetical protein